MYDTKCIFSAHIMCMVHTPFKVIKSSKVIGGSVASEGYVVGGSFVEVIWCLVQGR